MMEVAIINRLDIGLMIGFSYFKKDHKNDFSELNLYLLFFVIHIKWWQYE
tara:strand:+ start:783 stop:932 length:150 start_codon:yes stop_codon:yes gene_type:complete